MAEELVQLATRLDEMDKRLSELRTDVNQRFSELRTDMNVRFSQLTWIMGVCSGERGDLTPCIQTQKNPDGVVTERSSRR
jgi:hypothetical protein